MLASDDLIAIVKALPNCCGVYLFKDVNNKILYVGKANNLQLRVKSYKNNSSHKINLLRSQAHKIEHIVVNNEKEALLLENSLIKSHQPRFNVSLRDDKQYPYLRIDTNSKWPRIEKVRQRKNDEATYIGPFTDVSSLEKSINVVYSLFPLVRCSDYIFRTTKKPCIYS